MFATHHKFILKVTVLILLLSSGCDKPASTVDNAAVPLFSEFQGNYFKVQYPSSFKPEPSLPAESGEGYDSVFFHQPDGAVSFYLCAPAWKRSCSDFEFDSDIEVILVKDEPVSTGLYQLIRMNVEAKDKSYQRLLEYRILEEEEDEQYILSGASYDKLSSYEQVRPYYVGLISSLSYPSPQ